MPEIIQLPQNGGNQNGGMSVLPVANGGGLFGANGQTSLTDILGFAVIASIFPNIFGGYGYGNRGGGCPCQSVEDAVVAVAVGDGGMNGMTVGRG